MATTTNLELIDLAKKIGLKLNGVYSKNNLPDEILQGGYIINMSDDQDSSGNDLTGSHWVAVCIDKDYAVYIDSFGLPIPADILLWLNQSFNAVIHSTKQIQDKKQGYCGLYALFSLYFFEKNKNINIFDRMHEFQKLWSSNPKKNLTKLKVYMKHVI